jgi:hypothetical protein
MQHEKYYYSQETIRDSISGELKPLFELTDIGDRRMRLIFVRSGNGFTFGRLISIIISYAKSRRFTHIELEDDALFLRPCPHRALFRRAFEGKAGIYESKGWRPNQDTGPLISIIAAYTVNQAIDLQKIKGPPRGIGSPASPVLPNNGGRFGVWINAQNNRVLRYYYNTLLVLSSDRCLTTIDKRIDISTATKSFLHALRDLRSANKCLVLEL